MNDYINIGKIVNTFGIKGELKIISDFEHKDKVFIKDMNVYIGNNKIKETIESNRIHKNYNLILLKNYNNINDVLKYKNNLIYVLRSDLKLDSNEYLLDDLINCTVYDNDIPLGIIKEYLFSPSYTLLKVEGDKNFYIPLIDEYIKSIDIKNKKVFTNNGKDLII